jgi:hypothetical protein
MRLEGLGTVEKFNDLIGTRSRYLPAHCTVLLQPTTLSRGQLYDKIFANMTVHLYVFFRNQSVNRWII